MLLLRHSTGEIEENNEKIVGIGGIEPVSPQRSEYRPIFIFKAV
jgi:hypothetical protein